MIPINNSGGIMYGGHARKKQDNDTPNDDDTESGNKRSLLLSAGVTVVFLALAFISTSYSPTLI